MRSRTLWPNELVVETQRGIHDAVAREHDGIVGRSAADKALLAEHVGFVNEAERTGGRNVFQVVSVGEVDAEFLLADHRVREVDGVGNRIGVGGINRNEFVAFPQFEFASDPEIGSLTALLADSGAVNHLDERTRAAIEYRQLEIVEFHDCVVDTGADEGGEQVFGG